MCSVAPDMLRLLVSTHCRRYVPEFNALIAFTIPRFHEVRFPFLNLLLSPLDSGCAGMRREEINGRRMPDKVVGWQVCAVLSPHRPRYSIFGWFLIEGIAYDLNKGSQESGDNGGKGGSEGSQGKAEQQGGGGGVGGGGGNTKQGGKKRMADDEDRVDKAGKQVGDGKISCPPKKLKKCPGELMKRR